MTAKAERKEGGAQGSVAGRAFSFQEAGCWERGLQGRRGARWAVRISGAGQLLDFLR